MTTICRVTRLPRGPAGVSVGLVLSRGAGHAQSGCHPGSETVNRESSISVSERSAHHPRSAPGVPTHPAGPGHSRRRRSRGPQGPGGRPDCTLARPGGTDTGLSLTPGCRHCSAAEVTHSRPGGAGPSWTPTSGEAASGRSAPPLEPLPIGIAGSEGGSQTDDQSRRRKGGHSPPQP